LKDALGKRDKRYWTESFLARYFDHFAAFKQNNLVEDWQRAAGRLILSVFTERGPKPGSKYKLSLEALSGNKINSKK